MQYIRSDLLPQDVQNDVKEMIRKKQLEKKK